MVCVNVRVHVRAMLMTAVSLPRACDRLPTPATPQWRVMGYEKHVMPTIPSYAPLERGRVLRKGALEETMAGDSEPRIDERCVVLLGCGAVCESVLFAADPSLLLV